MASGPKVPGTHYPAAPGPTPGFFNYVTLYQVFENDPACQI